MNLYSKEQICELLLSKYSLDATEARSALLDVKLNSTIDEIISGFYASLFFVKAGYSNSESRNILHTEESVDQLGRLVWGSQLQALPVEPTIYLSHDIDYLWQTWPLVIKSIFADRKFAVGNRSIKFLESLEKLLKIDQQYTSSGQSGTCFLFSKTKSKVLKGHILHWIMDPSYSKDDPEFRELLTLINKYNSHIGIHGSFFAWNSEGKFLEEKQSLVDAIGDNILCHRAHWLNIKSLKDLDLMHSAGIRVDSSMGFNGELGFRGEMARPFNICVGPNRKILEVPLLVMDGPLFLSRGQRNEVAVRNIKAHLRTLFQRGGSASFDWHDRSAHESFGWDELYIELLDYSKELGFSFHSFRDLEHE